MMNTNVADFSGKANKVLDSYEEDCMISLLFQWLSFVTTINFYSLHRN